MHLNTTPDPTPRKPCARDMAQLISPQGLLPALLVKLVPLKELRRRCHEINATHPQYREETPLVLAWEQQRRQRLSGRLVRVGEAQPQVA